jgi:hypothetical protein
METIRDNNTDTFEEAVFGALVTAEHLAVQLTTAGKIELASSGRAIGVAQAKSHSQDTDVLVRLLGKNGTVKMKQSGAIATGAAVTLDPSNAGKVRAIPVAAGTYRALGTKKTVGSGAAGDVIEVIDVIETIIVAA